MAVTTDKKKIFRAIADLCTGCRECELVCSLQKTGSLNPDRARLRVQRSFSDGVCKPVICRHCKVPHCKNACPVAGAMYADEATGAVVIDRSKCDGCLACVKACPFDAMWIAPDGEVLKCDLCEGDPICVKYCPSSPDHLFPDLPYPRASALEYVLPNKATRRDRTPRDPAPKDKGSTLWWDKTL